MRTRIHGSTAVGGILRSAALGLLALAMAPGRAAGQSQCGGEYTEDFRLQECRFDNNGRTAFFVLEPGYFLRLEGTEGASLIEVTVTVLNDTEVVDGIRARVVEERELVDGELAEVSRNFFVICVPTNNLVYLGEEVDIYEDGEIVSHEGAWRAGVDGARAGVLVPGSFMLGARYFQEIAPDVAMDRGCNVAMNLTEVTPAHTFTECVEVLETTPLEPSAKSTKAYCPGVGLVRDDVLRLVDWSEAP